MGICLRGIKMKTGKIRELGDLYGDIFQKIYSNTLTSATTTITIAGLNGDVDEDYELRCRFVNGYNGSCDYYLRPNNDSTADIYGCQVIVGIDTAVSALRATTSYILINNPTTLSDIGQTYISLKAKSGYVRTAFVTNSSRIVTTTVSRIYYWAWVWNNTADNITSLVITASQTNGLGVGTVIELFAKRSSN
jgi:hypothetical protein